MDNEESTDGQVELGLDEPPETIVNSTDSLAEKVGENELMQWWNEFIETQTMKTASLMKMIRPAIDAEEVVVKVAASKIEVLEAARFAFNRFISTRSGGKLKNLRIEQGEVQELERKPYTEKEKLDYLIRKNPELDLIIKKLGLRLP